MTLHMATLTSTTTIWPVFGLSPPDLVAGSGGWVGAKGGTHNAHRKSTFSWDDLPSPLIKVFNYEMKYRLRTMPFRFMFFICLQSK